MTWWQYTVVLFVVSGVALFVAAPLIALGRAYKHNNRPPQITQPEAQSREAHATNRRWWEDHPAYQPLITAFKGSTRSPEHTAFLAITSLRAQGYEIHLTDWIKP